VEQFGSSIVQFIAIDDQYYTQNICENVALGECDLNPWGRISSDMRRRWQRSHFVDWK